MGRDRSSGKLLRPGQRLGSYEIVGLIGAGGSGEVYRARDARLGRDVAIKALLEGSDHAGRRQVEREARASGALDHPNLLSVHDVGTEHGVHYLVLELLEGESLRQRLAGARLRLRDAVDYGIQIARGLAVAHEKGFAHRDLKPENVFLADGGHVKILDFGLASPVPRPAYHVENYGDDATTTSTDEKTVRGTAGYMSPEQVRGGPVDHRSDVFALGAVLFEMLSGKRAFQAETRPEVQTAILRESPPDLSVLNRQVPRQLASLVSRCLAKRPAERFQSVRDVAFLLEDIARLPTARRTTGGLWAGKGVRVALAMSLAIVAIGDALYLLARRATEQTFAPLSTHAGIDTPLKWGAKTRWPLALAGIWRVSTGTGATGGSVPVPLVPPNGRDAGPQFSPDDRHLVIARKRAGTQQLWLCGADGRNCEQLTRGGFHRGTPRWSPDGRSIVFDSLNPSKADVFVVDPSTRQVRRMTTHTSEDAVPSWSRDGRSIYFGSNRGGNWQLWRMPAGGGTARQVTRHGGFVAFEGPDGEWLYYTKRFQPGIWRMPAPGGQEELIYAELPSRLWGYWAVAEHGLYYLNVRAEPRPTIEFRDDRSGNTRRVVTFTTGPVVGEPGLGVSADGRWLAFAQLAPRTRSADIGAFTGSASVRLARLLTGNAFRPGG